MGLQNLDGSINRKLTNQKLNQSYEVKSEKPMSLEQFHEAQRFVMKKEILSVRQQKQEAPVSHIKFLDGQTIYKFDRSSIMTPQHYKMTKFFPEKQFENERKIKSRDTTFRNSIVNQNINSPTSEFSYLKFKNEQQHILSQYQQSINQSNNQQSFLQKVELEISENKSQIPSIIQGYKNRIMHKNNYENFHQKYQKNIQESLQSPQRPNFSDINSIDFSNIDIKNDQKILKQDYSSKTNQINQQIIDEDVIIQQGKQIQFNPLLYNLRIHIPKTKSQMEEEKQNKIMFYEKDVQVEQNKKYIKYKFDDENLISDEDIEIKEKQNIKKENLQILENHMKEQQYKVEQKQQQNMIKQQNWKNLQKNGLKIQINNKLKKQVQVLRLSSQQMNIKETQQTKFIREFRIILAQIFKQMLIDSNHNKEVRDILKILQNFDFQEHKINNHQVILEFLKSYVLDHKSIKNQSKLKFNEIFQNQDTAEFSSAYINYLYDKNRKKQHIQKNEEVLNLQNNDNNISKFIQNQDPDAIEIFNLYIKNKVPAQKKEKAKKQHTAYEILQKIKERLLMMLKNQKSAQQCPETSEKIQSILQQYQQDHQNLKKQKSIRGNYSGIEKLRKIVEEQLIKKSLKKFKIQNINEFQLFDLYRFKLSLQQVFDQKAFPNIGRKYFLYGSNIFKNEYMRQLGTKVPHFQRDLRVNLDSDPWSLELQQDKESLKIVTGQKRTEINSLFKSSLMKKDFFQVIKRAANIQRDELMKTGIQNFYSDCGGEQAKRIISPNLLQFNDRVMFLSNLQINENFGKAYKNYFILLKSNQDYQIKELIIENCQMDDETLEMILKGIVSQNQIFYEKKKFKSQIDYLRSFVYSKNFLSIKGAQQLYKALPGIFEIKLDNLKILNQKMLLGEILHNVYYHARYLMRLMITNMDIGSTKITKCLINIIMENKYLQQLDITSTNMKPKHLLEISNEIKNHKSQFREINFSYNKLDFSVPFSNEYEQSQEFLENIREILESSRILNHINLSGMMIEYKEIIQICKSSSRSPILMALHLSDNGIISMDEEYLSDCLICFGMTLDDMPVQRRNNQNEQELFFQKDKQFKYVDLQQAVKKYTRAQVNTEDDYNLNEDGLLVDQTLKIKNNIDLGKELKDIMQSKAVNQTRVSKSNESKIDFFVMTRNLNHPEIIFNQNVNFDNNKNTRFFVRDFESRWRVSLTNECFVCDKYQFVLVFYERGNSAKNQDLIEIKDKAILEHLTYDYKKNYLEYRTDTPLICGSLVNRKVNQKPFERKLKMLRASLFSLLSICQQKDFATKQVYVNCIKNGIIKYLQHDKYEIFQQLKIDNCFNGWEFPLNDMILNNELTDLKTVNFPDLTSKNIGKQDWFVFAGFFQPGYHQLLIHDPFTERAYFKDIVVQLNQREFVYPEYPVPLSRLAQVVDEDIWKDWKSDNYKLIKQMYSVEVLPQAEQYIRFMKSKDETEICLNIIYNNYDNINYYFKELLTGSRVYPLVDFDNVYQLIGQAQEDPEFKWYKIPKPQIYIQYLSTLKNKDGAKSTNIQRAELIEFILRIAKVQVIEMRRSKEKVSTHLHQIFRDYIYPVTQKSNLQSINKMIRNSYRLNKLIEDNLSGLQKIYEYETNKSEKILFDRKTAIQFFKRFVGNGMMEIENQMLEQCFIFSMMTVHDEKFNIKKYEYLYYVEFQDMLCRVAYFGFQEQEPIQYKVFWLLEYIWEENYKKGIWKPDMIPLYTINTDVIW